MGHFTCVGTMVPQRPQSTNCFVFFIGLYCSIHGNYCTVFNVLYISVAYFYSTFHFSNVSMCCVFILCSSCGEVVLGGNHMCHHSLQKQILTGVCWLLCSVCVLDGFCVMSACVRVCVCVC